MTSFHNSLIVLSETTDTTVFNATRFGDLSISGQIVMARAQATSVRSTYYEFGTKAAAISVTALNSSQSTAFSTSKQPYVLLCLTVGGTTVAAPFYPAGTLS